MTSEHNSEGTMIIARVNSALAVELAPYEILAAANPR
jgi:hypothetical protein